MVKKETTREREKGKEASPGKVPWTEEPGQLASLGLQRVRHDSASKHITLTNTHTLHR